MENKIIQIDNNNSTKILDEQHSSLFSRTYIEEFSCTPEQAIHLNKLRLKYEQHNNFHKQKSDFNPNKFKSKFAHKITLTELQKILKDKLKHIKYPIPRKLYDRINQVFKLEFFNEYNSSDKRIKRKFQTRLNKGLYLVLAIYNFNEDKNREIHILKNKNKLQELPIDINQLNKIKYKYDVTLRISYK